MRTAIIGNGVAGIEAAGELRAREPDWDITIVSDESDHVFARTAMMDVMRGQLSHHWYWPMALDERESSWIAEVMEVQGIHVHLRTEVAEFLGDGRGPIRGVSLPRGGGTGTTAPSSLVHLPRPWACRPRPHHPTS